MANWYGTARSNYVRFNDLDALKNSLAPFGSISISEGKPNRYCLLVTDPSDDGGWPSCAYDENDNEVIFDPIKHICPFLHKDDILIMMQAGAEKLRYITGYATAYDHEGKHISIVLDDIYTIAKKKWNRPGKKPKNITTATY